MHANAGYAISLPMPDSNKSNLQSISQKSALLNYVIVTLRGYAFAYDTRFTVRD
ncbi:hypothetical protein [Bifidobacterium aquikefiri]|uniref:hypothetical protein n=1 Tax=Bifidobacterium aquikefiri TaxID=1653207 RepID=UPI0039EC938A